jgi:hypothetical protein
MAVSWSLSDDERRALATKLAAVGAPALVEHAARIWRSARETPWSARLFLPQWLTLAAPSPGAPPSPLDALGGPSRTNEYLADMAAIAAEMRQNGA